MKVGIYGGSFNPPHLGHINAIQTVAKKNGLGQIRVVPAALNPLKRMVEGATPAQRLEMTRLAFADMGESYVVDDQEVLRGGASYTIDTVLELRKTIEAKDLFLIIGLDNLEQLPSWKSWKEIIKETNLIVTSRPGWDLPESIEELPEELRTEVEEFDFNFVELKSGRSIQFLRLKDVEISASELRKAIRIGRKIDKYLPLSVENYIREQKLYASLGERIPDFKKFTEFCANVLNDKKAVNIRGFDLRELSAPSEFTLVASGTSTRHATSLGENLMEAVKEEYNVYPQSLEGVDEGRWVLVDYGALIVHIFYDFVRQDYALENLWKSAKELSFVDTMLKK